MLGKDFGAIIVRKRDRDLFNIIRKRLGLKQYVLFSKIVRKLLKKV